MFFNGIFLSCYLDKLIEIVYTFILWCKTLCCQFKFKMLVTSQEASSLHGIVANSTGLKQKDSTVSVLMSSAFCTVEVRIKRKNVFIAQTEESFL